MKEENKYKDQFLTNNLWVFFGHLLVYARGLVLLPLLIKTVGARIYAANALLLSYFGIVYGVSSLGVGFKYSRYMPSAATDDLTGQRELFYFQFVFHLLFVVVFTGVAVCLNGYVKGVFLPKGIEYSVYAIVLIMLGNFLFSQTTNYFRYTHRLKYTSIFGGLAPYVYILFIVGGLLFVRNIGVGYLMFSNGLSYLVLSIPLCFMVFKELGFRLPRISLRKLYEDIKLGFPLTLILINDFILSASDRFVLSYYMTSDAVAYYNPGYALGSLPIMLPKMIGVSLPQILALASDSGNEGQSRLLIEKSIKIFMLVCIPFIAGATVLGHKLIAILANRQIADAGYWVAPIVALGTLFYGLSYILANTVFYLRMKNNIVFYSNVGAAVVNVLLNIIFVSIFKNVVVAAVTTFASYLAAFVFLNFECQKLMSIRYDYKGLIKMAVASAIMVAYVALLRNLLTGKVLILFALVPSAVAIYSLLVYSFGVIDKKEIKYLYQYFSRSRHSEYGVA